MKIFIIYEMLRSEQVEKEKPKARQQEEQGHKNRNDIDERLARYKKAGLMY